jgi:protein SCO1/2
MIKLERRALLLGLPTLALALRTTALRADGTRSPVELSEHQLLDARTGRPVRLIADVMRKRVVVLNFVFADCSTTCPLQSLALSHAQDALQEQLGRNVVFVSISLDPTRDTPARLRHFADKHAAGAHWHFLTGDAGAIAAMRKGFGVTSAAREDHPPVISIGAADAKYWSRLYGLPKPATVVDEVHRWLERRDVAVGAVHARGRTGE